MAFLPTRRGFRTGTTRHSPTPIRKEAVFFRHAGVPGNVVGGAHHRLTRKVSEAHAGGCDDGHFAIVEKQDFARVGKDGGSIGGDKIFVVPYSDDRRRSVARHHDLVTLSFQNH